MAKTLISESKSHYWIDTGRGTAFLLRKVVNAIDNPYSDEERMILTLLGRCVEHENKIAELENKTCQCGKELQITKHCPVCDNDE